MQVTLSIALACAISFTAAAGFELLLGAQGTANAVDADLEPYYGTWPVSWEVFLRLRPASKPMAGHGGMHHHDMGM